MLCSLGRHHIHIQLTEVRFSLRGKYSEYFKDGRFLTYSLSGIYPRMYIDYIMPITSLICSICSEY